MITIPNVLAVLAALWAFVSAVVALTPTKTDDAALGAARAFLERLSFLQPQNSPGVVSLPGKPATRPFEPLDPHADIAPEDEP